MIAEQLPVFDAIVCRKCGYDRSGLLRHCLGRNGTWLAWLGLGCQILGEHVHFRCPWCRAEYAMQCQDAIQKPVPKSKIRFDAEGGFSISE